MSTFRLRYKHRKRVITTLLTFLLVLSILSAKSSVVVQAGTEGIYYSIKSTVTYVNPSGGSGTWSLTTEDRTIGLFMNNSWQTVTLRSTTYPLDFEVDDGDGNKVAVLRLPKQQLSQGENVTFTAEYWIVSKPRTIPNISENDSLTLDGIPQDLKDKYTGDEGGAWLINNSALRDLAYEIAGNETNVLRIIKGFIKWIHRNITYPDPNKPHEVPYYPNETLNERKGDCDDQAILLMALSRIMEIPSYLQIGPVYMPTPGLIDEFYWNHQVRIIQRKIGWHGWAMVYIPPWGWLPVDLTFLTGGSFSDPLSAIRYGAVAKQNTIQYMNISKANYVTDSHQAREFLIKNGFHIISEDEMTVETAPNNVGATYDPSMAGAFLVTAVATLLAGYLLIARRWNKRLEKQMIRLVHTE